MKNELATVMVLGKKIEVYKLYMLLVVIVMIVQMVIIINFFEIGKGL